MLAARKRLRRVGSPPADSLFRVASSSRRWRRRSTQATRPAAYNLSGVVKTTKADPGLPGPELADNTGRSSLERAGEIRLKLTPNLLPLC